MSIPYPARFKEGPFTAYTLLRLYKAKAEEVLPDHNYPLVRTLADKVAPRQLNS